MTAALGSALVDRGMALVSEVVAIALGRSLILPKRAIDALTKQKKRQAAERLAAGAAWYDTNLVFCREDGHPYTKEALNWRFSKMIKRAGIHH